MGFSCCHSMPVVARIHKNANKERILRSSNHLQTDIKNLMTVSKNVEWLTKDHFIWRNKRQKHKMRIFFFLLKWINNCFVTRNSTNRYKEHEMWSGTTRLRSEWRGEIKSIARSNRIRANSNHCNAIKSASSSLSSSSSYIYIIFYAHFYYITCVLINTTHQKATQQ